MPSAATSITAKLVNGDINQTVEIARKLAAERLGGEARLTCISADQTAEDTLVMTWHRDWEEKTVAETPSS